MRNNGKEALIAAAFSITGITTMAAIPYLVKPRFTKSYGVLFAAGAGLHTLGVCMFHSACQAHIQREQSRPSSPPAEMGNIFQNVKQMRASRPDAVDADPDAVEEQMNTIKIFDTFSAFALEDLDMQATNELILELERYPKTSIQSGQLEDAKKHHKKVDEIPK